MDRLPNDLVLHIDTWNSMEQTHHWRSMSKYFSDIFNSEYCETQTTLRNSRQTIIHFIYYVLALISTRKRIIDRIINEPTYRNNFFYAHMNDTPHICIHYERIPRGILNSIKTRHDIYRLIGHDLEKIQLLLSKNSNFGGYPILDLEHV